MPHGRSLIVRRVEEEGWSLAQRALGNGRWRTVASAFSIRQTAVIAITRRGTYRFRNESAGDADHVGCVSAWKLAKVT